MNRVLDLNPWQWAEEEPSGDSDKQWLIGGNPEQHWLFKPLKPNRSQDEASSEYAAARLASSLGAPAAHVELGKRDDDYGCVSANVISDATHSMVDGAMFISAVVENFDPKDRRAKSFDHATSLGVSTRGKKRDFLLADADRIQQFARLATAHRFEGGRQQTLVEFAERFLRRYAPADRQHWLDQLMSLERDTIEQAIADSKMSEPGSRFALELLHINRERIVECLNQR